MSLDNAAIQIETTMGADGLPKFRSITPKLILQGRVKSKNDLVSLLYQHRMENITQKYPTIAQRRYYMERIRPALRWYCKTYKVPVPSWLVGNGVHENNTTEHHETLFGPVPLRVIEFKPWHEVLASSQPVKQKDEGA